MVPLFMCVLVLSQTPTRTVEQLTGPPTIAVTVERRDDVTITVQPPTGLSVLWTVLDLPDSRSWAKPTKSEPLPKNGARATFRHPRAPYAIVVRLSDGAEWRAVVAPDGRLEIRQTRRAAPIDPL